MSDVVDTLEFEGGLTADIIVDQDVEQPFKGDDAVKIVVLHRRYPDPSEGTVGSDPAEIARWCKKREKSWYVIPLFMYDHSGTIYGVGQSNPFSCPWDSGRAGIIALKRQVYGVEGRDDDKMLERAKSIAEVYTDWANGSCYGYVLKDKDGEELDSCWGYIGREDVDSQAADAAKNHAPALVPA